MQRHGRTRAKNETVIFIQNSVSEVELHWFPDQIVLWCNCNAHLHGQGRAEFVQGHHSSPRCRKAGPSADQKRTRELLTDRSQGSENPRRTAAADPRQSLPQQRGTGSRPGCRAGTPPNWPACGATSVIGVPTGRLGPNHVGPRPNVVVAEAQCGCASLTMVNEASTSLTYRFDVDKVDVSPTSGPPGLLVNNLGGGEGREST